MCIMKSKSAAVVQLVEQRSLKSLVVSSNLTCGTKYSFLIICKDIIYVSTFIDKFSSKCYIVK